MIARLWVGGGILIHGLHELGVHAPEDGVQRAADPVASRFAALKSVLTWLVSASLAAVLGVLVGARVAPLSHHLLAPAFEAWSKRFGWKPAA